MITRLLVLGSAILAQGPFNETEGTVDPLAPGEPIWTKHIMEGWRFVDLDVPDDFVPDHYLVVEDSLQLKGMPLAQLTELRKELAAEIEAAVAAVYSRPVLFSREYELREADAVAYKATNYEGTAGRVLLGFAAAKGLSSHGAADLVLAQAEAFRGAELTLADLRMQKYAVERAVTEAAVRVTHLTAMTAIRQIAAAIA